MWKNHLLVSVKNYTQHLNTVNTSIAMLASTNITKHRGTLPMFFSLFF